MPRCQCRNIINNKICLNKSNNLFIINNKYYCNFHMNYYYNKYVIIIQAYYRGHKIRNKINNIYKKLPYDIQYNILNIIYSDFYNAKLNKKLEILVTNKLNNFIYHFKNIIHHNIHSFILTYFINDSYNIESFYNLFIKYKPILSKKKELYLSLMYNLNRINKILYNYSKRIFVSFNNNIYQSSYIFYRKLHISMINN